MGLDLIADKFITNGPNTYNAIAEALRKRKVISLELAPYAGGGLLDLTFSLREVLLPDGTVMNEDGFGLAVADDRFSGEGAFKHFSDPMRCTASEVFTMVSADRRELLAALVRGVAAAYLAKPAEAQAEAAPSELRLRLPEGA